MFNVRSTFNFLAELLVGLLYQMKILLDVTDPSGWPYCWSAHWAFETINEADFELSSE